MAGKPPASQFYWGDLRRDPEYHMMSWSARGIWVEMLACMHFSAERGKLEGDREQIARMIGCTNGDFDNALKEVSVTKTGDVTESNGIVTIINRRMFREERERKLTRCRVQKFRNAQKKRNINETVTLHSSSSSSSSIQKKYIKKSKLPDEEWIKSLQFLECYSHLNVKEQLQKCLTHFDLKNITVTRHRFLNWINNPRYNSKPLSLKQEPKNTEPVLIKCKFCQQPYDPKEEHQCKS